jgi:predicted kinase
MEEEIISKKIMPSGKKAIILIGVYATGKTTFVTMYLKNIARLSIEEKNSRRTQQSVQNLCNEKLPFVIDGTNITKKDRKPFIEILKKNGYEITALYFCSVTRECILRNRKRPNAVPDKKITDMAQIIELPSFNEGFSEIFYVDNLGGEFSVEEWE